MNKLVLSFGFVYIDTRNKPVKMVREFEDHEADHKQGFRFRGDNGTNYTADGGVEGQIGMAHVRQAGAYPLVRLAEVQADDQSTKSAEPEVNDRPLVLEEGSYYRNGLGQAVRIIGIVNPGTRSYNKGLRFMDHRGSFYTVNGSVQSTMFAKLNLRSVEEPENVDVIEQNKIDAGTTRMLNIQRRREDAATGSLTARTFRVCKKLLPIASGANIGAGLVLLRIRQAQAFANLAVGALGLTFNHFTSEEI